MWELPFGALEQLPLAGKRAQAQRSSARAAPKDRSTIRVPLILRQAGRWTAQSQRGGSLLRHASTLVLLGKGAVGGPRFKSGPANRLPFSPPVLLVQQSHGKSTISACKPQNLGQNKIGDFAEIFQDFWKINFVLFPWGRRLARNSGNNERPFERAYAQLERRFVRHPSRVAKVRDAKRLLPFAIPVSELYPPPSSERVAWPPRAPFRRAGWPRKQ